MVAIMVVSQLLIFTCYVECRKPAAAFVGALASSVSIERSVDGYGSYGS